MVTSAFLIQQPDIENMETVSTEELVELKNSGEDFVLVDVLGEDHYQEEHIPGALNIPLDQIAVKALEEFDKDQEIIVYCASESCGASPKAAQKLEKLGFENVKDYETGVKGWKEAGHEVEA